VRIAGALGTAGTGLLVLPPRGPASAGLLAAAVMAAWWWAPEVSRRLESRAERAAREALIDDLPLALDLLGACLAGGASPVAAATAVAGAVGGPLGERLTRASSALAVGAPPDEAWALLAPGTDDPLAPVARALARAARTGAPVASAVARVAAETRAAARTRSELAARRAGVLAVAPLGLCFLPSFLLLGVVPVVVGLVGPLLQPLR
jgi:pilus assembly protein TadC